MGGFTVSKPYTMARDEVRSAAEELANALREEHGLRYSWQGDTARFSRSGLEGTLNIEDDCITLKVKLGMLASAFERPLKKAVTEYLDNYVS